MSNIIKVFKTDIANGPGIRVTVWFAGCSHGCAQCHNKETWKANQGVQLTDALIDKILDACKFHYIEGLTLSGGDPMDIKLKNYEGAIELIKRFKKKFPNKTVWVWTGEMYEDLKKEWLEGVDVIVDGKFEYAKKDISLVYRGSRNQRIIDVKQSLASDSVVLL